MGRNPKASRPSFFKVLINDYTNKLKLPHAFVKKYGEFLPENAKLRTSSGETWDVKLEETDDDDEKYYCFTEGWNEFVKDLELKLGEFLVFWFNIGKSTFDVSVCGVNGCEREISAKKSIVDVDSDDADEDLEFSNDQCRNVPEDCSDGIGKRCPYRVRKRSALAKETSIAYQNAIAFASAHTFHKYPYFISLMQPSYVSRGFHLCVPLTFAKGNLPCQKTNLTFRLKNGKSWLVRCCIGESNAKLTSGWKDFVKDNALKLGDACIFEVAKSNKDPSIGKHLAMTCGLIGTKKVRLVYPGGRNFTAVGFEGRPALFQA